MKIECILIRDGGTHAEIGGVDYHFRPSHEHDGRHVAIVDDPLHAERFISIAEAYRMLPEQDDGEAASADADAVADADAAAEAERTAITAEAQEQAAAQAAATIANAPDLSLLTRIELVALHEARFGRKPHHRLAEGKLREILAQPPAAD